jgi:hypothetical protein
MKLPIIDWKLAAITLAIGFAAGAFVGYQWLDGRNAKQDRQRLNDQIKETERVTEIAQDIGKALAKETRARGSEQIEWQRRLRDANNKPGGITVTECPSDPAGGVARNSGPGWLSPQFVGLLNQSLCRGEACNSPGVDGDAGAPIGVQAGEFLIQADQNHERWAKCRAQLDGWQDLAKRNGWIK